MLTVLPVFPCFATCQGEESELLEVERELNEAGGKGSGAKLAEGGSSNGEKSTERASLLAKVRRGGCRARVCDVVHTRVCV